MESYNNTPLLATTCRVLLNQHSVCVRFIISAPATQLWLGTTAACLVTNDGGYYVRSRRKDALK